MEVKRKSITAEVYFILQLFSNLQTKVQRDFFYTNYRDINFWSDPMRSLGKTF